MSKRNETLKSLQSPGRF
uniref:Uncharacterized protein n=1 Tax=Arundo donax TaxID=35708 RepID=A0A0A9TI57_ARUDO